MTQFAALDFLRQSPNWVCWKSDKCPFNPISKKAAITDTPDTWGTYEQAVQAYKQNKDWFAGIGRSFHKPDGITGIDLDKCIAEDGTITEWAKSIVLRLNSYTEISPSGRGLHIFVRGSIPKNHDSSDDDGANRIEMYDCTRYFTWTSNRLPGTPETIEDRQSEILTLHSEITISRKLARLEKLESQSTAKKQETRATAIVSNGDDTKYGLAALNEECASLANIGEGSRNTTLNKVAFRIGQLVGGKQITRATAERELFASAQKTGLDEGEIEKTMQRGLDAGEQSPAIPPVRQTAFSQPSQTEEIDPEFALSCLSQAEWGDSILFAKLFRGKALYDHTAQEWYLWKSHYWELDECSRIKHLVSGHLASVYLKAGAALNLQVKGHEGSEDDDEKARIAKLKKQIKDLTERAFQLRQVGKNKNVLSFASSQDGMSITAKQWDRDAWLIAVPNGVIDLRTGMLRDGKPEDYIRSVCPTEWRGLNTPADRFERFLDEIFEDREFSERQTLIAFMRRMLGYGITGDVSEHIFAVFWGENGRNGKDTLQHAISHVLGGVSSVVEKDVLLDAGRQKTAGSASPHLMDLQGKRIAWANEPEKGARFNLGQVKDLSGGALIPARGLFEKKITKIDPSHLLVLLTNHKPHADPNDSAFWSRLRFISFNMRFVPNPVEPNERNIDTTLWRALESEASGILAWLVRGCLEWQANGLNTPQSVLDDGQEYREEEDLIRLFLEECCIVKPEAKIQASVLYAAYEKWCEDGNMKPFNSKNFGTELTKRKIEKKKLSSGFFYLGIGILASDVDENAPSMHHSNTPCIEPKAALQANLQGFDTTDHAPYAPLQQKVTNIDPLTRQKNELTVVTMHTMHSQNLENGLKPLVEPSQTGMHDQNTPCIPPKKAYEEEV